MELKSFDTILTDLCDTFDEAITPQTIERTNTNIIYLILKAFAKGLEVINNVCVTVSNKFDPARCTDEDLVSVAHIVGTERRGGTASGLHIFVTNNDINAVTLQAGVYTYTLDADTVFEFEVVEDTEISAGAYVSYIAMSRTIGRFPVTEQASIKVESEQTIDSNISFSCTNNASLLGNTEETILAFRNRILGDYTRQESMQELEETIRNLPYIFDCKVVFNQTDSGQSIGSGLTLPPMTCAIFYSGEVKRELAQIIASRIICPTLESADSVALHYESSVFINGYHTVNIIPFSKLQFTMDIAYRVNDEYVNTEDALKTLDTILKDNFASEKRVAIIKEEDVYEVLARNSITGVEILSVILRVGGTAKDYIDVPQSQIAELTSINWGEG